MIAGWVIYNCRSLQIGLQVVKRLQELGISMALLRGLYSWLEQEDVANYAIRLVVMGYQTFLIMGSDGKPAIWTSLDLADYLFIGAETRKNPDVIICLNEIVNVIVENIGYDKQRVKHELFYTERENIKEIKFIWQDEFAKIESPIQSNPSINNSDISS